MCSASDALEHCSAGEPCAVVVTAYLLPDLNGVELLRRLRARAPDTVGVLVTEVADLDLAIAALHDDGVHRYVRKPFQPGALVRAVEDAADYYRLVQNERLLRDELARINAELDEKIKDLDEANGLLEYWIGFSHRAGNRVHIVDSMRAVRDGDGQTVEVVGAWLDVTGRG